MTSIRVEQHVFTTTDRSRGGVARSTVTTTVNGKTTTTTTVCVNGRTTTTHS